MKKNLYITKRRYSEHILPVTWPVLIEVPYGNDTFMSPSKQGRQGSA